MTEPEPHKVSELTGEEREFVIWALGFVEGAARNADRPGAADQARAIADKLMGAERPASNE